MEKGERERKAERNLPDFDFFVIVDISDERWRDGERNRGKKMRKGQKTKGENKINCIN